MENLAFYLDRFPKLGTVATVEYELAEPDIFLWVYLIERLFDGPPRISPQQLLYHLIVQSLGGALQKFRIVLDDLVVGM